MESQSFALRQPAHSRGGELRLNWWDVERLETRDAHQYGQRNADDHEHRRHGLKFDGLLRDQHLRIECGGGGERNLSLISLSHPKGAVPLVVSKMGTTPPPLLRHNKPILRPKIMVARTIPCATHELRAIVFCVRNPAVSRVM